MSSLISHTMGTLHQRSVDKNVDGNNSLSVCVDMDDDQQDASFLDSLAEEEHVTVEEEELEEEFNVPPFAPKLQFKEVIQSIDDSKVYLEDRGLFDQATAPTDLLAQMASSHASSLT